MQSNQLVQKGLGYIDKKDNQKEKMKKELKQLREEAEDGVEFIEEDHADLVEIVSTTETKDMPPEMKLLLEIQMKQLSAKSANGHRWDPLRYCNCYKIIYYFHCILYTFVSLPCHNVSPKSLDSMHEYIILPSNRLIRYYKNSVDQKPGWNLETIAWCKHETECQKLKEQDYWVGLVLDEMKIQLTGMISLGHFHDAMENIKSVLGRMGTTNHHWQCNCIFEKHTHGSLPNIAAWQELGEFQNLFIGLNENGQVLNWRLMKTTAFDRIEDMLIDFKHKLNAQSTQLEMIIVDDCCTVRQSYQRIFSDTPIKLDIFHACQQFVKILPKGFSLRKKLSSEFGLIFCQNGDTGEERRMTTPSVEDVECNLEMFLQKWEKQLSELTMDAIKKLRNHIRKGCCSGIPPKAGTQKNERLHKLVKKSLLGCKRDPIARKHSSNTRIIPVVPVALKNQHLLSNFASDVTVTQKFDHTDGDSSRHEERSSAKCDTTMKSTNLDEMVSDAITHNVKELCNESVLNYIILRALHLNEPAYQAFSAGGKIKGEVDVDAALCYLARTKALNAGYPSEEALQYKT
ncbi:Hypothetical predicted protein [Paramuricea clavata]|uniref:Uncharacterized protein n=1 Tax=Paramuricea clavata TaxID=317549 RepID=A0A6S7GDR8_PARCT|nr:Hypothetical predicted protein [Paramuricea clavata]